MRTLWMAALACGALAAFPASGAEEASACAKDPQARGMQARVETMRQQMDHIEWATDDAQKRQLMELHAKHMREGLHQMRTRKMQPDCQLEMMGSMMESMARYELVMQEAHGH